jgi:hypothetical protein
MDLLCLEDAKEQCAQIAWKTLCCDMERTYDRLELSDIADHAAFANWARSNGADYDLQIVPRGVCPIADLSGGFEAYLSRLSANSRQQVRRLVRAAGQQGVHLESATSIEQAYGFFKEMAVLHQKRWESAGQPGCFSSPSFTTFHRQLIRDWLPSGKLVLTRLRVGDLTLAVKYGFKFGEKFDFYQAGVRTQEESPIKSPGIVSFILLMQHLIGQGVTCFDFLRGSSSYKQRLATTAQPLICVRKVRWTIGTTVGFVADIGARGMRRAGRLASGVVPAVSMKHMR